MNIDEVLERIHGGDRQAYAAIVTRFQGPLFAYLGRMGCSAMEAEELAQEAFVRAWIELRSFDARRGAFSTWLFTIARNLALNELDRAARRRMSPVHPAQDRACEAPQPPDRVELEQRRSRLRAALLRLPAADRSVLALAYVEELAMADIARIEGCSTGSVKVRLHRARRKLAAIMGVDDERER
jgi:RNA polymerase sigma-70 factor, ECF subfamily